MKASLHFRVPRARHWRPHRASLLHCTLFHPSSFLCLQHIIIPSTSRSSKLSLPPSVPCSLKHSAYVLPAVWETQVSHPYKATRKIKVLHTLGNKRQTQYSAPNCGKNSQTSCAPNYTVRSSLMVSVMSKGADPNSLGSTLARTFHEDSSAA